MNRLLICSSSKSSELALCIMLEKSDVTWVNRVKKAKSRYNWQDRIIAGSQILLSLQSLTEQNIFTRPNLKRSCENQFSKSRDISRRCRLWIQKFQYSILPVTGRFLSREQGSAVGRDQTGIPVPRLQIPGFDRDRNSPGVIEDWLIIVHISLARLAAGALGRRHNVKSNARVRRRYWEHVAPPCPIVHQGSWKDMVMACWLKKCLNTILIQNGE